MFIDDHREPLGVEAICKVLPIAPSTYYQHKSIERDPEKASARAKRDTFLMTRINIYWERSRKRYGAVKIWHDLLDEGTAVARCTVVHHSDRGVQYLSIKYTERLEEAKIDPSVGSVGDSYDNAMAETINGLYKAEVIKHEGPWQGKKDVEFATLNWVHWFNHERRYGPIGYIAPAQAERNFYESLNTVTLAAQ